MDIEEKINTYVKGKACEIMKKYSKIAKEVKVELVMFNGDKYVGGILKK